MAGLQEQPKGANTPEIAEEAAVAILRNDLRLMIVDEADRLNEDSFELLRHLFDKTGCPIALVGLPGIWNVINRHEKFKSRIGLHVPFSPLDYDEFLHVVLPQLTFPKWRFDVNNAANQELAKEIWRRIRPSFRKLCNLLWLANKMASEHGHPAITLETIREACGHLPLQEDRPHSPPPQSDAQGGSNGGASGDQEPGEDETRK